MGLTKTVRYRYFYCIPLENA